ncbi:hypothetical protein JTE90_000768 [Oedothorax gibbosus]|uniref:DNA-(apurinic or apyrimidinic site) endonuclease n=1 Tax=Oedothorax gibbosus TaxID=931172 RepID=A0AAV6UQ27_9ARAC|nr:hypothetical protein JTE90_000768 [Oedothorax gibbosus]
MKITTWNVNGIRSLKKSVATILNELSTDIACFQETKVSRSQIPETTALVEGFSSYFSYPRKQSGYSGVAIYCREKFAPEDAEEGLSTSLQHEIQEENALACWALSSDDLAGFDHEGRVVTTYHIIKKEDNVGRLAIINVYCPRVDPEKLERHIYKMQFCLLLEAKTRELCEKGCSVIIVGDMNIAHSVIDHCDPGPENEFNSSEARQWLRSFLSSELKFLKEKIKVIDAFRHLYPDKKESFTCWNTKTGARQTNYGTRIDYILMSSDLLPILENCEILSDYQGSDHCPVQAVLKCDAIPEKVIQLPSICTRLWPEFNGQQQTLKTFFQKTEGKVAKEPELPLKSSVSKKIVGKKNQQKSITNFFKSPKIDIRKNCNGTSLCKDDGILGTSNSIVFPNEVSSSVNLESKLDVPKCVSNGNSAMDIPKSFGVSSGSSMAWKQMLTGPPKPPLCSGHQKECVLRTVKKKGPNYGRNFFMCAQPAGHASNPDASCNYFKWVNAPKVNSLKKS